MPLRLLREHRQHVDGVASGRQIRLVIHFLAHLQQAQPHFRLHLERKHQKFKSSEEAEGCRIQTWVYIYSVNSAGTPDERDERLEALSEALAQLIRRQRELEERVRALESATSLPTPCHHASSASTIRSARADPSSTKRHGTAEPVPLETTFGLNWINRIAVFTLLLGAAFLFKYGVDNDWFGPGARVALGIAAAVISLLAGDRLWRRGQTVFAQGIIGLGLALLYLSIYAAAMLYQLAAAESCVRRHVRRHCRRGRARGAVQLAGGRRDRHDRRLPDAARAFDRRRSSLDSVRLRVSAELGSLLLARKRHWKALEPIAAAATILLYAAWFGRWFGDANRPVATVFAFAFYAQFSVATLPELWAVFQLAAAIALALIWRDHSSLRLVESSS